MQPRDYRSDRTYVRYADDFVVLCKTYGDACIVKEILIKELDNIGLELSEEKTRITHLDEGFDFLGWEFRRYSTTKRKEGKIVLIKPSKKNIQDFKNCLKEVFKELRGKNQEAVITKLSPILRGWANYHRSVVSKEVFSKLDDYIFHKLKRWSKRLHGKKKSWEWLSNQYWGKYCLGREDKWVYGKLTKYSSGFETYYLEKLAWTPIIRHNHVYHNNSPDDPKLTNYWEKRRKKNMENRLGQKLSKGKCDIAKSTNYVCRWCNERITSEGLANIQIHHIVPRRLGGRDSKDNKIYLHSECHRQVTYMGEINSSTLNRLGVKANYNEKKGMWRVKKNY